MQEYLGKTKIQKLEEQSCSLSENAKKEIALAISASFLKTEVELFLDNFQPKTLNILSETISNLSQAISKRIFYSINAFGHLDPALITFKDFFSNGKPSENSYIA